MIAFPNAKINIGLFITARRPDGYHDIATVMMPADWCDILEIVPAKDDVTTLTVTGRSVDCPPEKNLVMRAYRAMEERYNLPPVDIFLRKIIPDGAGLGGGSADAAFTITTLDRLFGLGLSADVMAGIAATIGSDCPFFIYNRPMLATGTGTTPVACRPKSERIHSRDSKARRTCIHGRGLRRVPSAAVVRCSPRGIVNGTACRVG